MVLGYQHGVVSLQVVKMINMLTFCAAMNKMHNSKASGCYKHRRYWLNYKYINIVSY